MHISGADRTEQHDLVHYPDCEDHQHRFSRPCSTNSQIALFPFGMQQVRGNQQVVLLKEAFDLCLAETMFLAMSPIPVIPLKAGKL